MNTKRGDMPSAGTALAKLAALAAKNESLRSDLAETSQDLQYWYKEAERRLDENNALRVERDGLAARVDLLRESSEQVSIAAEYGDVATTLQMAESVHWLLKVADETPVQSVAHIKAAGAREALKRALYPPNFSDTVVRVDRLEAVIADMESES